MTSYFFRYITMCWNNGLFMRWLNNFTILWPLLNLNLWFSSLWFCFPYLLLMNVSKLSPHHLLFSSYCKYILSFCKKKILFIRGNLVKKLYKYFIGFQKPILELIFFQKKYLFLVQVWSTRELKLRKMVTIFSLQS